MQRGRGTRVGCAGTRVRCRVGRIGACSVAALCCHGHGSAQHPGTRGTLPGARGRDPLGAEQWQLSLPAPGPHQNPPGWGEGLPV